MFRTRPEEPSASRSSALLASLAAPLDVFAQAWVPAKGEGAVAIAFQSTNVKKHLATTTPVDAGPIDSQVLLTDVTYGLTDKIAVDFSLPLVTSKYTGNRPHAGTNIDDGKLSQQLHRCPLLDALQPHARQRRDYAVHRHGRAQSQLRVLWRTRRRGSSCVSSRSGCMRRSSSIAAFPGCSSPAATATGSWKRCWTSRTTGARRTSRWATSSRSRSAPSRWPTGSSRTAASISSRQRPCRAAGGVRFNHDQIERVNTSILALGRPTRSATARRVRIVLASGGRPQRARAEPRDHRRRELELQAQPGGVGCHRGQPRRAHPTRSRPSGKGRSSSASVRNPGS